MENQEKTNLERITEGMELVGFNLKDLRIFAADKVIEDFKTFINSEELKEVHTGFQSKTSVTEKSFDTAYVVGKNVYVLYKADGIMFLAKESIGSSIDNGGLYDVMTLPTGFVVKTDNCYDKSESNRKIWRKQESKVLTSAYID